MPRRKVTTPRGEISTKRKVVSKGRPRPTSHTVKRPTSTKRPTPAYAPPPHYMEIRDIGEKPPPYVPPPHYMEIRDPRVQGQYGRPSPAKGPGGEQPAWTMKPPAAQRAPKPVAHKPFPKGPGGIAPWHRRPKGPGGIAPWNRPSRQERISGYGARRYLDPSRPPDADPNWYWSDIHGWVKPGAIL